MHWYWYARIIQDYANRWIDGWMRNYLRTPQEELRAAGFPFSSEEKLQEQSRSGDPGRGMQNRRQRLLSYRERFTMPGGVADRIKQRMYEINSELIAEQADELGMDDDESVKGRGAEIGQDIGKLGFECNV
jgi:hypothetical protein